MKKHINSKLVFILLIVLFSSCITYYKDFKIKENSGLYIEKKIINDNITCRAGLWMYYYWQQDVEVWILPVMDKKNIDFKLSYISADLHAYHGNRLINEDFIFKKITISEGSKSIINDSDYSSNNISNIPNKYRIINDSTDVYFYTFYFSCLNENIYKRANKLSAWIRIEYYLGDSIKTNFVELEAKSKRHFNIRIRDGTL